MAGVSGLQNDWRTLLQRQPTIDRTTASRQALEAGLVLRSASSFDVIRAGGGLGISALPGLAMPHAPYSSIIGIPLVEPVIRRTLGIIRRKDAVLSPAAERFFALLINLWTDDKDNLWTNIVERQRHALQEIG